MLNKIIVDPFTRINDCIKWSSTINTALDAPAHNIVYDNRANCIDTHHQFDAIQKSFLYVCTETVFDYPHSYISEKSFKGITTKRPFIILGAPGTLELLKLYGFKTFSNWWNEDYDTVDSVDLRLTKVYNIINNICNLPVTALHNMCNEMAETLEYNFMHYDTFRKNQINEFEELCIRNLKRTHV